MSNIDSIDQFELLKNTVQKLEERIQILEKNSAFSENLPKTSLLSNSFLKRSFAVLGHYFVSSLIIIIPLYILMILLMFLFGVFK